MNNATNIDGPVVRHENDHDASPEQLEREVDHARARLGKTVSALSDRLSPGELIDQALGMAREHGGELGRNLGSQVKQNPIPMILTGIGISWMMMSSGKHDAAAPYTDDADADQDGRSFKEVLGDAAAQSRDKAGAVRDRVRGAGTNVKESAQNARESLVQFYRDQPLLAGSVGIAIGAALGALVPPSELEDDLLGEARDRSVDAAKSKAASKYDDVRASVRSDQGHQG